MGKEAASHPPAVQGSAKPMRDQMPGVAAFVDSMREAFGQAEIDTAIKAGLRGEEGAGFWARENGKEIGRRVNSHGGSK